VEELKSQDFRVLLENKLEKKPYFEFLPFLCFLYLEHGKSGEIKDMLLKIIRVHSRLKDFPPGLIGSSLEGLSLFMLYNTMEK
jgi:hypothetical protein